MATLAAALGWQVNRLLAMTALVEHSDRVIALSETAETQVIGLAGNARSMAFNRDLSAIETIHEGSKLTGETLRKLRQLVDDDPQQAARADAILQTFSEFERFNRELEDAVAGRGLGLFSLTAGRGKQLVQDLRQEQNELYQSEARLRDERSARSRTAANTTLSTGVGLTCLLGIFLAFSTRRNMLSVSHNYEQALASAEALAERQNQALTEARRVSRMKDEFLATLSHELRTPLSAILGWSQLLSKSGISEAELCEGLSAIERNSRAQAQLIDDLLDMSRIVAGKMRLEQAPVDLVAVIRAANATMRPVAQSKGVTLGTELGDGPAVVIGDASRLQQIVWNLLTNAVKFTPEGGSVTALLKRGSARHEVRIVDTGQGIEPAFLPHVFERFLQADGATTRRHGGLGLGLSLVSELVQMHRGSVAAESEGVDRGSTFVVRLPAAERELAAAATPTVDAGRDVVKALGKEARLTGIKVLLVDDEADSRSLHQHLLQVAGADVATAGSAVEALSQIENQTPPDLLLCDIAMPDIDGHALIQRIRSLNDLQVRDLPAAALTAFARPEDRIKALRSGFQLHLSKPVEPAELVAAVASLARARRVQASTPKQAAGPVT